MCIINPIIIKIYLKILLINRFKIYKINVMVLFIKMKIKSYIVIKVFVKIIVFNFVKFYGIYLPIFKFKNNK